MPVKRGNSMIRGSGHGYHGNKAKQGSMIRRRSKVDPAVEEEAVFDMILLEKLNEESIVANITHMYMEVRIWVDNLTDSLFFFLSERGERVVFSVVVAGGAGDMMYTYTYAPVATVPGS